MLHLLQDNMNQQRVITKLLTELQCVTFVMMLYQQKLITELQCVTFVTLLYQQKLITELKYITLVI